MEARTIRRSDKWYVVEFRGAAEKHCASEAEARAYIAAGAFPSVFDRRGASPYRR